MSLISVRFALFSALFVLVVWAVRIYLLRECLTVEDLNKTTTETKEALGELKEQVTELKNEFDNQESRMAGAATEAAQKQALLHSNVYEHTTSD